MVSIDLRSWRNERRKERQKQFITLLLLVTALSAAICFGWYWFMQQQITYHQDRNQFVKQETAKLDAKITEIKTLKEELQRLRDRMAVVSSLQDDRPVLVHVFDELVQTLEDGAFYDRLSFKNGEFNFIVNAEANALTEYLRKLEASPWFKGINISKEGVTEQLVDDEVRKRAGVLMKLHNPLAKKKEDQ